jgi:hypothetical protein
MSISIAFKVLQIEVMLSICQKKSFMWGEINIPWSSSVPVTSITSFTLLISVNLFCFSS